MREKLADRLVPALLAIGAVLTAIDVVWTFTAAPLVQGARLSEPAIIAGQVVTTKLLLSQKIFYLHVPVAVASFAVMVVAAFIAARFLATQDRAHDRASRTAMQVTLVFIIATMISGDVWTRFEWGVWWVPLVQGARLSEPAIIAGQVVTTKLLLSQKIFYLHVPVAVASFAVMVVAAFFAARFLATKDRAHDRASRTAMQVTLVFIIATMISGDVWTRFEWGVWWVWEPRLTTYFILRLLVIGYFILRNALDDPERSARFGAEFCIIAFIDAPISFFITRLVPSSVHPVVFRTDSGLPPAMLIPFLLGSSPSSMRPFRSSSRAWCRAPCTPWCSGPIRACRRRCSFRSCSACDSGLPPAMLIPFLLGLFGMCMIAFALYRYDLRVNTAADEVEELKERLEELDASAQRAAADEALERLQAQAAALVAADPAADLVADPATDRAADVPPTPSKED